MMDLIHKQVRKPLESLSPYFRYTQQLYFENPKDTVLDVQITGAKGDFPNRVNLAYRIDTNILMLIQYDVKPS